MSSFDKIVKLACKPKAAPPKAKYIDPIIAATWSDDGAVSDVCKALVPRIREPNHIVVFKALIVLHTMIRNGSTDNVLSYLSQTDILRLKNVSAGNWEGYSTPENMQNYALYLHARIRAYRDLKHDAIRVQADTNRDIRNSMSMEEDGLKTQKHRARLETTSLPTRSKTIVGRKLRSMTVEKGLLRETKVVHGMIDALVECRFYLDDLEDELNITALQMLVKDLLILFQAGNEGVINVLEHYFEMSHIDAEEALNVYRHFCTQTEKVVEYLGVAKKLQNLLNVPIPNIKHAPVSLAGALQEYLDDANFEQNRIEYKANKEAAERPSKRSVSEARSKKTPSVTFKEPTAASSSSPKPATTNGGSTSIGSEKKAVMDFFSAIEEEQQSMFASPPNSAPIIIQQQTSNPFSQMLTGQPFMQPQLTTQPTGFLVPQHTAFQAPNPFNGLLAAQQQPQQQTLGHRPFSAFIPQQQTGFPQQPQQSHFLQPQQTGFLQPQVTGANPFRQSMLLPQSTGMALFANAPSPGTNSTLSPNQNLFAHRTGTSAPNTAGPFSTNFTQPSASTSAIAPAPTPFGGLDKPAAAGIPNRPSSTPLTSRTNPFPVAQPVKTHQTGTKNPFGPVIMPAAPPPPVPKVPTLMELAMGFQNGAAPETPSIQQQNSQQQQQQQQPFSSAQGTQQPGGFNWATSALNPGATDIPSVASSFTNTAKSNQNPSDNATGNASTSANLFTPQNTTSPSTGSAFSSASFGHSSLSGQPTGMAVPATTPSISVSAAPLKSQVTGFAGLKAFKPSSSFGAALLDSLPPVPGSNSTTPQATTPQATTPQATGTHNANGTSGTTTSASALPSLNSNSFNSSSTTPSFGFGSTQSSSMTTNGALNSPPTSNFNSSAFGVGNSPTFNSTFTGSSGSTLGSGLRPQITGGGAANPFRASMMAAGGSSLGSNPPPVPGLPPTFTGQPFGGQQLFAPGGAFSTPFNMSQGQQQQQNAPASLF